MAGVNASRIVQTYYGIALDLAVAVVFLVGLKLGMLFLMQKLSALLRDDDVPAQGEQPRRTFIPMPPGYHALRVGFGAVLTASGLIQILPQMVSVTVPELERQLGLHLDPGWLRPLVASVARLWVAHSIWFNVLSCAIQLVCGTLLLTTRHRAVVWPAAVIAGTWGLLIWVGTGFGGLWEPGYGLWRGAPGAGILYAASAVLLLLPRSAWSRGAPARWALAGVGGCWIAGIVLQLIPFEGFWGADGWSRGLSVTASSQPGFLFALVHAAKGGHGAAIILNAVSLAVLCVLAGLSWFGRRPRMYAWIATACLLACWIFLQDAGLAGGYGFALNTAPLLLMLILVFSQPDTRGKEPADA